MTAAEVARKWNDAIGHDPLLREFWNSTLGLPYHANELDLSEDDIQNAIGKHGLFLRRLSSDGRPVAVSHRRLRSRRAVELRGG